MSEKVEDALTRLETIKEDLNRISKSFEENFGAFNSTLSSGYDEIKSTGENVFQAGAKKIEEDAKEIQENAKKQNSIMQEEIGLKLENAKTAIISEIDKNVTELKNILKDLKFVPKMDETISQFNMFPEELISMMHRVINGDPIENIMYKLDDIQKKYIKS